MDKTIVAQFLHSASQFHDVVMQCEEILQLQKTSLMITRYVY